MTGPEFDSYGVLDMDDRKRVPLCAVVERPSAADTLRELLEALAEG